MLPIQADFPTRLKSPPACLLGCALALLVAFWPSAAHASYNQPTFFEAPRDLVQVSAATRAKTLDQLQRLGVKALRVELYWASVAPAAKSAKRPSFDATNPAGYHWDGYDPLLAEAVRLKWQVLLTVTSPVPRWATAGRKDTLTRPSASQFEEFMTAVGRHYGSEVSLYAIWNEPNHPQFLMPQFNPNGTPASPRIYRALFQAGYAGLRAADIFQPKVLMGETAPFGFDRVNPHREHREAFLHPVAPLAFLREALCLNSHYRKSQTCGPLLAYGYGHHAYTNKKGPSYRPPGGDDVTLAVLSRLSKALDSAAAAHALPGRIPVYLTEFGIQSYPNHILGVPLGRQAEYDALAEKMAWENPRVAAFSQYLLRDDPLGGKPGSGVHGGSIGFQTGLETLHGRHKPLYAGFPIPLVVSGHGSTHYLWGLVRPSAGATTVKIEVQRLGSRRFSTLASVKTDARGYWSLRSPVAGTHWRVSWRSPTGAVYNGPSIGVT